ncbi:MAG: molybdate transport system substrate-binding protein [Mucilaginibacter sp.]|nr:molybdate transport system substrate-binding protein [Mucilaginibacter sp.]
MKSHLTLNKQLKRISVLSILCLLLNLASFAQRLKVAAAANLQSVMRVLQKDFVQKYGIEIDPIIGSSGNLVAQMQNGAPFDVFLSADMNFPKKLYEDGLCLNAPAVYAFGSLIICSTQNLGFENWARLLMTGRIKKIAIGNPAIAPYGLAAQQALQHKGIITDIKNKLIYGESISQVNTYITTSAVEVGFTTQSLVKDPANKTKLYWKAIDPKLYSPIEQGMVILKSSTNKAKAYKFYKYLLSPAAKKILQEYGYHVQ